MNRQLILDAICGSSHGDYEYFSKIGLLKFTGNQWNTSFEWDRKALDNLTTQELEQMYEQKDRLMIIRPKCNAKLVSSQHVANAVFSEMKDMFLDCYGD